MKKDKVYKSYNLETLKLYSGISEIDITAWEKLVKSSNTASFFQTLTYYNFCASLSFFEPFVFGISENEKLLGIAVGYIIANGGRMKQHFSRRAIIQGGLLLDDNISSEALNAFLNRIKKELKSKVIYIELRNENDYSEYKSIFQDAGFAYQPHLNYRIALKDEESVFKQLSDSKKRQIKAAQKNGSSWEETKKKEDISAFYSILEHLYKSKIKRPLFPVEFIEKMAQQPYGKLLVVKNNGLVIGGMLCAVFDDNTLYEMYVCGDETVDKKFYPSVMATWAGIEYAIQNKIRFFDFMGAGKPDQYYGVREFKSKFGGNKLEYGRFLHICKPFLYRLGKYFTEKIFPKLTFYKV